MSRKASVRNRRIGMELKKLREQLAVSMVEAGDLLERSPSSISYIENGYGVHARVLAQTLDRYQVTNEPFRAALLELARADRKSGWWQRHARELSPDAMDFISLEAEARRICT